MKSNKGMGIIQLIIMISIIILIIALSIYFIKMKYNDAKVQTIKTDMLQVQWKLKDYMDKQTVKGEEKEYLGTKVSQLKDETLIKEFITKNVITEEEYEKYYVLSDEDLSKAELGITNYENSYYLVNYETYEIIITKGCKYTKNEILYKLSDIENKTNNEQDNINNEILENETNIVEENAEQ